MLRALCGGGQGATTAHDRPCAASNAPYQNPPGSGPFDLDQLVTTGGGEQYQVGKTGAVIAQIEQNAFEDLHPVRIGNSLQCQFDYIET